MNLTQRNRLVLSITLLASAVITLSTVIRPVVALTNQEKENAQRTSESVQQEKGQKETEQKTGDDQEGKPQGKNSADNSEASKSKQDTEGSDSKNSDDKNLDDKGDSTDSDAKPLRDNTPLPIDWSIKGTKELNFDHMKFNIQPDEKFQIKQLTADLIKLRGHKIRIRGYIRPAFRSKGITNFILVRDNQECCFGPGAALYDCMIVNLKEGEETDFSTRPITVEGTFQLKPFRLENKVMAILQLQEAKVD